jgi:kynurenine 3-monooxygenase
MRPQAITLVGAGLAGALLAVLLARRGFAVTLYDKRPDPREHRAEGGRSINLALAARGMRALERAGVLDSVRPLLIPMRGRMVHERTGATTLHPYGWKPDELIYSAGRAALNRLLIEAAAQHANVTFRFDQTCLGANPRENTLTFRYEKSGATQNAPMTPAIATDGAGSAVRSSLAGAGFIAAREEMLDHDYKELNLPATGASAQQSADTSAARANVARSDREPRSAAKHGLDANALHIWPRGGFMLIALPNTDGSFTATLFLSRSDFAGLTSPEAVRELFDREFPDAVPLIPDLAGQFLTNPQGQLGTVYASPWHIGGQVLLLGDAAHAIVPFHGQGMNAAFEDCAAFDELLDSHDDWSSLFTELERRRKPNADAIAQMALENYIEMRDTVLDPRFQRQKLLAVELEKRFPDHFIPRYSMVMFHPEIPYSEALMRGAVQARLLRELDDAGAGADSALASSLVSTHLRK